MRRLPSKAQDGMIKIPAQTAGNLIAQAARRTINLATEIKNNHPIGILGAGTWGAALARMLANAGKEVTLWSPHHPERLAAAHAHPKLPGVVLPDSIKYTKDLKEACTGKEVIVFVVPSVYIRETARLAKPYIPAGQIIANASKGMEKATLMTLSEVIADELGDPARRYVALSGPTHAEEVAQDMPTTIVAASSDTAAAGTVQQLFSTSFMRVYTNSDRRGTEICGALKNIIALASGISVGLGFGDNARAALITRGLAELARVGGRIGCAHETFAGLAGVGDLIVTCTSRHSRNNRCGYLIGRGLKADAAVKEVGMVVEGINALPAAMKIVTEYNIDAPIIRAVNEVISCGTDPRAAVKALFARGLKAE